ncbi:MAG: hypothetical protein GY821_06885 [Gammaproteobacteria bacterium]|nr:hypothetical protein [Gammaproteobacteria bacterium]
MATAQKATFAELAQTLVTCSVTHPDFNASCPAFLGFAQPALRGVKFGHVFRKIHFLPISLLITDFLQFGGLFSHNM